MHQPRSQRWRDIVVSIHVIEGSATGKFKED